MVTVPTGDAAADIRQHRKKFNFGRFTERLDTHEGRRTKVYKDTVGVPTIGVGFNMQRKDAREQIEGLGHDFDRVLAGEEELTEESVDILRDRTAQEAVEGARRVAPGFDNFSEDQQIAIADMTFNLGEAKLKQFRRMLGAIENNDWKTAAEEAKKSRWYEQVTNRAEDNIRLFGSPSLEQSTDAPSGVARVPDIPLLPPVVAPGQRGEDVSPSEPLFAGRQDLAANTELSEDDEEVVSAGSEIDDFRSGQLRGAVDLAQSIDPDKAAEADAVGGMLGIDPQVVLDDPEPYVTELRKRAAMNALQGSPVTAEFMRDPRFASQAHRDISHLVGVENAASELALGKTVRQFNVDQGSPEADVPDIGAGALKRSLRRMTLGTSQMVNQFFADNLQRRVEDADRSFSEIASNTESTGPTGPALSTVAFRWLASRRKSKQGFQEDLAERIQNVAELQQAQGLTPRAESVREMIADVDAAEGIGGIARAVAANPVGVLGFGAEMLVEQAPTLAGAAVAARVGGGRAAGRAVAGSTGIGAGSFAQERFRSPAEFLADKGYDATDPVQAMAIAQDPELMEEAAQFGFTRAAIIGMVDAASGGFASIALGSALRTAIINAGVQPFFGAGGETAALLATGQELDQTSIALEAIGEIGGGFVEPTIVGGQTLVDFRKVQAARQQKAQLDVLAETVQQSEFSQRAPDAAAAHVAQSMPAEEVYIPVSEFDRIIEEQGLDPADFYTTLGVAEQVGDARVLEGDIRLSPGQFARHILIDPEMYAALGDHIRESPEAFTSAEAETFVAEAQEEIIAGLPKTVEIPADLAPEARASVGQANRAAEDIMHPEAEARRTVDVTVIEATPEDIRIIPARTSPEDAFNLNGLIAEKAEVDIEGVVREVIAVKSAFLLEEQRGQGLGIQMYEAAIQEARKQGTILSSDQNVSTDGQRIWQALADRGYPVQQGDPAIEEQPAFWVDPEQLPEDLVFDPTAELADIQEGLAEAAQGADADIRSASAAASIAREELGLRQLFSSADEAGMTPDTYRSYLEAVARQQDGVVKRQEDKILRSRQKANSEAIKKERATVEEQARETVQNQPVYQAINGIGEQRLDRDAVVEALPDGEAQLDELPTQDGGRRLYTPKKDKSGVHPTLHAEQYGFPDGQTMLFAMIDAMPEDQAIQELTDREMIARHEDLLVERDAIEAARESLHIDRTAEVLAFEMNALREAEGGGRLSRQLIRSEAERRFGLLQLKDIRIDRFQAAQQRLGREAGKALRQGDRALAAEKKFHQLMNFEFARLGYKAREDIRRNRKSLGKWNKKGAKFPNVNAAYVNAIQQLLVNYNLGPRSTEKSREAILQDLAEQAQQLRNADGALIKIPDALLDQSKNWKDMMLDEWEALVEGVKNLEQQGRRVQQIKKRGELVDRAEVVQGLVTQAAEINDKQSSLRRQSRTDPSNFDKINSFMASVDAALGKVEFMLRAMDNGEISGVWQQAIFQPFADAQAEQSQLFKDIAMPILQGMDNLPDDIQLDQRVFIEPLGEEMKRSSLLMVALQAGNASNLDKLVRGSTMRPHRPGWTEEGVREALTLLTDAEADWVQSVWDTFEQMRPQIEQIYIAEFNSPPTKVERRNVRVGSKTLQGGYFPMMYEPDSQQALPDTAIDAMQQEHTRESVFSGFLVERTNFAAPVNLDMDRLPRALWRQVHYISHYDAVRDTSKVLNDPEVQSAVADKLGPEYLTEMNNWIKALAVGEANRAENNAVDNIYDVMRTNVTVATLGFAYTTLAAQILGWAGSVRTLGLKPGGEFSLTEGVLWSIRGMATAVKNPMKTNEFVRELSGEMRFRLDNTTNEINDGFRDLTGTSGNKMLNWARKQGLRSIGLIQYATVDLATWMGAYNQGISQGLSVEAAVDRADSVIRTSQATGALKDRSNIQRWTGVKSAMTLFSTFLMVLYAQQREVFGNAGRSPAHMAQAVLQLGVLLAATSYADALLRGEFPDGDDDEDPTSFMLKRTIGFGASAVPFFGRGIDAAFKGFDNTTAGAIDQIPDRLFNSIDDMVELFEGERDFEMDDIKNAIRSVGMAIGLPGANQIARTLDGLGEDDTEFMELFLGATE